MPGGFENDPHSQDGQPCPRNFFGLTNYSELQQREAPLSGSRAFELRMGPALGKFDTAHLRKIHWYLFQDVFPWAGELRVVGLAKVGGAPFANPQFIAPALENLLAELKAEKLLVASSREAFARRGAYYWGELNAIHPFREGNGRTQREFLRQLTKHAGHKLSWADLQQEENTAASILSHTRGDHSGLERLLLAGLRIPAENPAENPTENPAEENT